jgi:hypothetical protein
MVETRLPDCRPPRRDESLTSASSHPELISGDFAMQPRPYSPSTSAGRPVWSRRTIAACGLVAAAVLVHAMVYQPADAIMRIAGTDDQALAPSCLQWHQAASEVVSRLARSTSDLDLRRANDAIFRMRRARRNCEEGWFTLACQDYYAIARSLPGFATVHQEGLLACQRSAERSDGDARPGNPRR